MNVLRQISRLDQKLISRQVSVSFYSSHCQNAKTTEGLEITFDEESGIQTLKLNRPKKLNAINRNLYAGIPTALNNSCDDPKVKITVLTGAGRYFSSGNDLPDFAAAW
jgi:enoyl-CoA hydratase/carnithine racemase